MIYVCCFTFDVSFGLFLLKFNNIYDHLIGVLKSLKVASALEWLSVNEIKRNKKKKNNSDSIKMGKNSHKIGLFRYLWYFISYDISQLPKRQNYFSVYPPPWSSWTENGWIQLFMNSDDIFSNDTKPWCTSFAYWIFVTFRKSTFDLVRDTHAHFVWDCVYFSFFFSLHIINVCIDVGVN